jgi:hypothetical protein
MFRRQRCVFRNSVRSGGTRLLAQRGRRIQGLETGKPIARQPGLRKSGQYLAFGPYTDDPSRRIRGRSECIYNIRVSELFTHQKCCD